MGQNPITSQLAVNAVTPTPLASGGGGCMLLINLGSTDVWLGGSDVSPTKGILLVGTRGQPIKLSLCQDWYAICGGSDIATLAVALGDCKSFFLDRPTPASTGGATACKQFTGGWGEAGWYQAPGTGSRITPENTANLIAGVSFHLGAPCTVTQIIHFTIQEGGGGGKGAFGIADLSGNILLQGQFISAGSNGALVVVINVAATLIPAGNYYFIWAGDVTLLGGPYLVQTITITPNYSNAIMNAGTTPRFVKFANLMSGGVMPSPLGAISAANLTTNSLPVCEFMAA